MDTFNKYHHYRGIFTRKIHRSIPNATNNLLSDALRRIWLAAVRSNVRKYIIMQSNAGVEKYRNGISNFEVLFILGNAAVFCNY